MLDPLRERKRGKEWPFGPYLPVSDAAGIDYISLGGVVPNPRLSLVYEGIELCRKEGVDFILPLAGAA